MFRKMLTIGSLIIVAFLLVACGDNRAENETETVINYDITAPLHLEEKLVDESPFGKNWLVPYRSNSDEEQKLVYYNDNMTVRYRGVEQGEAYFEVSNGAQSKKIPAVTMYEGNKSGHAYVYEVDYNSDDVKELFIMYYYELETSVATKCAVLLIDTVTLETIDVIAPSGTMLTQKQAEDVNKVVNKWKETYPEYLYLWEDIQGATEQETGKTNETTNYFGLTMNKDKVFQIQLDYFYYGASDYRCDILAQLAYVDGAFVVEKVILDAQRY